MKEYLTFILPYVKPTNESSNRGNIPRSENVISESELGSLETPAVEDEHVENDDPQSEMQTEEPTQEPASPVSLPTSQLQGTRRRRKDEVDIAMCEYLKRKVKKKKDEPEQSQNKNQYMNHFFLSLLPEFDDMTGQQIRTFKIKVLQLIDDIKQNQQLLSASSSRQSTYSTESMYNVYSPISSAPTPTQTVMQPLSSPVTYEGCSSSEVARNFSTQFQPLPSPIHLPYDCSINPIDKDSSYNNL